MTISTDPPSHSTCVPYLPELLAGVFASYSLEDLCASRMLVNEASHLVHTIVDNDIQTLRIYQHLLLQYPEDMLRHLLGRIVLLNVLRRELLRHLGGCCEVGSQVEGGLSADGAGMDSRWNMASASHCQYGCFRDKPSHVRIEGR